MEADNKKRLRWGIGSGVATVALAAGLAFGIPAIAQASTPSPSGTSVDTNDGETADDTAVEDGTNDGETADDQGVEDGTPDGETAD